MVEKHKNIQNIKNINSKVKAKKQQNHRESQNKFKKTIYA